MPPQGLLFRLSPMLKLYRDVICCWQTIKPYIEQVTPHYSVAIAHSAMAAQCLARQQMINPSEGKSIVSLDTENTAIDEKLEDVELKNTNLAKNVVLKLGHIGITRLGDLLSIPLKELAQRFDIDVVNTLGKINGELRPALSYYQPSEHFSYYLELHFEIQTTALLARPVSHLLKKLEQYLVSRELLASHCQLTLFLRDKGTQTIDIDSAQGEQKSSALLTLCTLKLERTKLTAPVLGLTLKSTLLVEKQTLSGDIFSPNNASSNQLSSSQLISLLQAKLGDHNVQRISHHHEHAPEYANRQQAVQTNETIVAAQPSISLLRPSYLLPVPIPWSEPVTIMHGPERIVSHWWQENPIERDYYIAKNSQQQWCWLFKKSDGQWFIHGYFG